MPQGQHSIIQGSLLIELTPAWRETGIAQAFPELRCSFGGRAVVHDVFKFSCRFPQNLHLDKPI
jgi:hypothetical protein